MRDIENDSDIKLIVDRFYEKVLKDDVIGSFFTEVRQLSLEEHLPKMYGFWRSVVFNTGEYRGNPMRMHLEINSEEPIEKPHFDRWVELFTSEIDKRFDGPNAEKMKQRALSIATMMQVKIHHAK